MLFYIKSNVLFNSFLRKSIPIFWLFCGCEMKWLRGASRGVWIPVQRYWVAAVSTSVTSVMR